MIYLIFCVIFLFIALFSRLKKNDFYALSSIIYAILFALSKNFNSEVTIISIIISVISIIFMIILSFWQFYRNGIKLYSFLPLLSAMLLTFSLNIMILEIEVVSNFAYFIIVFNACGFISFCLLNTFTLLKKKSYDYDFVLIHGARVFGTRPSLLLKNRIKKAKSLYKKNENAIIICSGGMGDDEEISEALAIRNELLLLSVPNDKIILEDKSKTTYENLLLSKEIGDTIKINAKYAFVTNDYHAYRVITLSKKLKMSGNVFSSRTKLYYFPAGFIREYFALLLSSKMTFFFYGLIALSFGVLSLFV